MIKSEYTNKIKEVIGITANDMLTEWNDKQNKQVEQAIKKLFIMKRLTDHRGNSRTMYTYKFNGSNNSIEEFFGLPYTSSSDFAMLGNTNTRYYFDTEEKYNINCFGLGTDGKIYIFCTDAEENEKVYQII